EHPPERRPVQRVEEVPDVELQVPAAALAAVDLADEVAQPVDGGVRALAGTVAEAVVDEARLVDLLEVRHEPVVHDAIGEVRRVDLARLGPSRDEAGAAARLPCAGVEPLLELEQMVDPARLEAQAVGGWNLAASRGEES